MKSPAGTDSIYRRLCQPKLQVLSLGIIWVAFQMFFLWKNGIVTSLEAVKYIDQAHVFLATGRYSSGNFLFYSVEIMLIAGCLKFHISYLFIVALQIGINGLSVLCFYGLTKRLSRNALLPLASTLYFLLFAYYHLFNTYLFTESLFFSFSVIYTWFLFTREKFTINNTMGTLAFLALLYLTRPTGIFFIPATGLFVWIKLYKKKRTRLFTGSLLVAVTACYFLFNYSIGSGGEFNFLSPYLNETIICGVSTVSAAHHFAVPVNQNSIEGILYVVTHHFSLFLQLAVRRLFAFFGIYRPYYSAFHNGIATSYFWLMYLIIVGGCRSLFKNRTAEVVFLLCNIAQMAVTVMLSCDEWGNRFILAVMPFFILLSVLAVSNYLPPSNAATSKE